MHSFIFAVLTFLATIAFAVDPIVDLPYSRPFVSANQSFTVRFRSDLDKPSSFDSRFHSFRTYLATTPPGSGTNTICVLSRSSPLTTRSLNLSIPADIGESGSFYRIATTNLRSANGRGGANGFFYSNRFQMRSMTGKWTEYEKEWQVGGSDALPCGAYACARRCAVEEVGLEVMRRGDKGEISRAREREKKCIARCPGAESRATVLRQSLSLVVGVALALSVSLWALA